MAFARRDSLALLESPPFGRILVVCYGNIYRSAFVAAYLAQQSIPRVDIRSAGFHPQAGRPVPLRHIEMSLKFAVDLSAHRSAILAPADLAWADLVVLMDRHNWQALVERGVDPKLLVWLGALDGGRIEIPDPYRLDDRDAARILERLAICSAALVGRLRS